MRTLETWRIVWSGSGSLHLCLIFLFVLDGPNQLGWEVKTTPWPPSLTHHPLQRRLWVVETFPQGACFQTVHYYHHFQGLKGPSKCRIPRAFFFFLSLECRVQYSLLVGTASCLDFFIIALLGLLAWLWPVFEDLPFVLSSSLFPSEYE